MNPKAEVRSSTAFSAPVRPGVNDALAAQLCVSPLMIGYLVDGIYADAAACCWARRVQQTNAMACGEPSEDAMARPREKTQAIRSEVQHRVNPQLVPKC
jgi:hypothetical protein